uniref:Ig-like domain-containing protein n=1 Tax=Peromyscus maniculatus bairdii TaxID=230844 RepID=A0A8C9CS40_PERMB
MLIHFKIQNIIYPEDFDQVHTFFLFLGIYRKPFLLALQPPLVDLGEKVTLECRSEIMFDTFILTSHKTGTIKDSFELSAEYHPGGSQANFSVGPVTPDDAGTYTCYGSYNHSPYEWSESSDPIDIKITGLYKKPSLSSLMGPVVMSGENMTLSCVSDLQFDMFHLSRKGVPKEYGLPSILNHNRTFQANFHLGPVVQAGYYRCYGSFRNSSHLWSTPSDPLYLPVTGKRTSYISHILLSFYMMVFLLIFLIHSWCHAKRNVYEEGNECVWSSFTWPRTGTLMWVFAERTAESLFFPSALRAVTKSPLYIHIQSRLISRRRFYERESTKERTRSIEQERDGAGK